MVNQSNDPNLGSERINKDKSESKEAFLERNIHGESRSDLYAGEKPSCKRVNGREEDEGRMDPIFSFEDDFYEKQQNQKKKKKQKARHFFRAVAAGVIGSAITLTVIPFTDYANVLEKNQQGNQEAHSSDPGKASPVKVVKPAATIPTIADMVEKASPAIVGIVNLKTGQNDLNSLFPGSQQPSNQSDSHVQSGSGSGVIFKKDAKYAYIVTNNHVIEGASKLEISLENGKKVAGELIGADALSDLAVVKIPAKYADSVLEFADSSSVRAGDGVIAIGNPLGLDLSRTVTQGIVSAVNRTISVNTSAGEWDLNVIQTDAAINPGNSGGALLNTSGQIVGINSLKISKDGVEGLGFAIPSNELLPIVNEIIQHGKVKRVYLGVGLGSISDIPAFYLGNLPKDVDAGVIVTNIDPNSAAAQAGMQVRDIIVSVNGTKIENTTDFRKYLYTNLKIGDRATFKVYRNGEPKTIIVTLTDTANETGNE
ncbi:S1C family serine protease [Bacillus sp. 1P06AnD]|uniref:S1C family serine protease n=1 Tax=Bacillus sp. 1P06AnD TaxID=3132208 RepID=UPI0039A0EE88